MKRILFAVLAITLISGSEIGLQASPQIATPPWINRFR